MATREEVYSPAESHEARFNQVLTRAYTLNWEAVAVAVILVLAVATRFYDLGARVMSHDESLHTYYSWRLYKYGEFSHTPLMHGPVIFHMAALSYFLFGDNDFTARIYPAALGVLLVLFPFLLRRWLGRVGAVFASAMLLISPMTMYYNRYIREDTPSVFFTIVFVYAALQYVDGARPRRLVWLLVMSGALLLSLASKEVAFIYIAVFGSFFTLFWLLRIVQDIGIHRRLASDRTWRAPPAQLALGHLLLLGIAAVIAIALGAFLRYAFSSVLWMPSNVWIQAPIFLLLYTPLAASGWLRNLGANGGLARDGAAAAIMRGLSNGRSALYIVLAGIIIGVIVTLLIVCVVDVIKPDTVWTQRTVMSETDTMYGPNQTKEYATTTGFDEGMFVRLLTWIGLPVLVLVFVVFLTAVFIFPGTVPLPWREMLLIILVALITTGGLVTFERRSFVQETSLTPFAVNPNATTVSEDGHYSDAPILGSWIIATLVLLGVLATRYLTNWWDFLNRQPLFDVLIVVGTLVLPWLAAFPLYWAGYNLEDYSPNTVQGHDTLNAAVITFIPFALVSVTVGLAWNWKRWLPVGAVFVGLFAFFFTTVFSNQYGLATGIIGSLGYWLEQQEVRRGSQPQYYYILTQLPVYEFLPLIGAMLAGVTGLSGLWRWRREQIEIARDEARAALREWPAEAVEDPLPETAAALETDETKAKRGLPPEEDLSGEDVLYEAELLPSIIRYTGFAPRLVKPFSLEEEQSNRDTNREWVGTLPFVGLVGYWAVGILLGLTIAGEKMPWLAIHLTVPLILLAGWWMGRVVDGLRWSALRDGGWLVLIVALPLAFLALAQVIVPLWGSDPPFQGRTPQELAHSGNWLAALLILLGALYLVGYLGRRMGLAQLGRMAIVSGLSILAVLTLRAAIMACFINYDYATEFLVYAHSGPAVKTVMHEVDRIAEITNQGNNMRIVFDDESSWPFTWYLRDYPNYGYLRGEAGSVDPSALDGAKVVIVGSKKSGDVRQILGDRFYEFDFIRLWWPMQEYFNLTYQRVANAFSTDADNVAGRYYRQGMWDIWLNRDYTTYGQAMCIEDKQSRCENEASYGQNDQERAQFRTACQSAVVNECRAEPSRFAVNNWPVSDRLYFFVDKQIAAQVWDAGIGSSTVNIREPEYAEDKVYTDRTAQSILGETAGLTGARGIVVAQDGLIYVTVPDLNRIVVLNDKGEQVRQIGSTPGGTNEAGSLRQPWGLDIGPDGNLYVADTWNHRIQVFTPDGAWLRMWGHEGVMPQDVSPDAFWGPRDVKIGPDGNVYVADTGNKRIRVYTLEGRFLKDIGSFGTALGQLDEPVGLAFNPVSGELYVAEAWNKRIQAFDRNGFPLRTWPVNLWFTNRQSYNRPYLAVSPDGTLVYVSDMDDRHRVVAYDLNGVPIISFNQPDNLEANLIGMRAPAGLAFDEAGRLYVTDSDQGKVYVFPPSEVTGGIPPQPPVQEPGSAEATEQPLEPPAADVTESATEPAAG